MNVEDMEAALLATAKEWGMLELDADFPHSPHGCADLSTIAARLMHHLAVITETRPAETQADGASDEPAQPTATLTFTLEEYHYLFLLVGLGVLTRDTCDANTPAAIASLQAALAQVVPLCVYAREQLREKIPDGDGALFARIQATALVAFGESLKVNLVQKKDVRIIAPTPGDVLRVSNGRRLQ